MKKVLGKMVAVIALATVGHAATLVGSGIPTTTAGNKVQESALAQNKNYILDINSNLGIGAAPAAGDILSLQLNVASSTIASATFKDGAEGAGQITVISTQGLVGLKGSDTLTVSTNSALSPTTATATILVSSWGTTGILTGSSITLNGYAMRAGHEWQIGTSSNTAAKSMASWINAQIPHMSATVVGGTVTVNCGVAGSACNSYAITSSTVAITVSATFSGGNDNSNFSVNGRKLTQGAQWSAQTTAANTAISIKNAINKAVPNVTASTTSANVVTITCTSPGAFCNSYTLASSTAALTVGSANFTGGQDDAKLTLNGVRLVDGVDWPVPEAASTTANVATAVASAINANSALSAIMTAGATGSVVYSTANAVGANTNYSMASSTPAALSVSGSAMTGGIDLAYTVGGTSITLNATPFTTGLQVLYSTGSNVAISGLTTGTTYYVGLVDANHIGLATSLANAQAATFVTLASSRTQTTANTFTLAPLTITGTGSFILQASDDGQTFANITTNRYGVSIASASLASPYTGTSFFWDLGTYYNRYLNLKATAPSAGAMGFTLYMNVKKNDR